MKSKNHKGDKNLAYVCFIDNLNLNLTPLGRQLMPPPMCEKSIIAESFPIHVDMFGHQLVALCEDGQLLVCDCVQAPNDVVKVTYPGNVQNVTKMLLFEDDGQLHLAFVETQGKSDSLVIYTLLMERKPETQEEFIQRIEEEDRAAFQSAVEEWRKDKKAGGGEAKIIESGGGFAVLQKAPEGNKAPSDEVPIP